MFVLFFLVLISAFLWVITVFVKKLIKIDFLLAQGHVAVAQTAGTGPPSETQQTKALWEHDSFTIQLLSDSWVLCYTSYCLQGYINYPQQIKSGTFGIGP